MNEEDENQRDDDCLLATSRSHRVWQLYMLLVKWKEIQKQQVLAMFHLIKYFLSQSQGEQECLCEYPTSFLYQECIQKRLVRGTPES